MVAYRYKALEYAPLAATTPASGAPLGEPFTHLATSGVELFITVVDSFAVGALAEVPIAIGQLGQALAQLATFAVTLLTLLGGRGGGLLPLGLTRLVIALAACLT